VTRLLEGPSEPAAIIATGGKIMDQPAQTSSNTPAPATTAKRAAGESPRDGDQPAATAEQRAEEAAEAAELSTAVATLTEDDLEQTTRTRLLGRIIRAGFAQRGVKTLLKPKEAIRWMVDAVTSVAPHIPIRDLDTLRRHHGGLEGDALAERLVRNAARVTGGIGAASGGVAAVEWVATPTLLSAPVLLAAETVAVVAVEIKLVGELHEVYGRPVPGGGTQRAVALLQAWAGKRGVNPLVSGRGVAAALGTAARKELRERLVRRFGRNLGTLGPFLTGAAVAGYLNRRATQSLGADVRRDLGKPVKVIEAG
jgi:hypothetical protein